MDGTRRVYNMKKENEGPTFRGIVNVCTEQQRNGEREKTEDYLLAANRRHFTGG